jgi:hypothetical protein
LTTSCDAQASQSSQPWWSGLVQWLSVALLLSVVAPVATHHVATVVAATGDGRVAQNPAAAKDKKPVQSGSQQLEFHMPYSSLLELLRNAKGTAGSMISEMEFNSDKKLIVTINKEEPLGAQLATDYGAAARQLQQQHGTSSQQYHGKTLNKFSVFLPPTALHPNVSARDTHFAWPPIDLLSHATAR